MMFAWGFGRFLLGNGFKRVVRGSGFQSIFCLKSSILAPFLHKVLLGVDFLGAVMLMALPFPYP